MSLLSIEILAHRVAAVTLLMAPCFSTLVPCRPAIAGSTIEFAGLLVGRSQELAPYSEDGFLVTPTSGRWYELTDNSATPDVYGNPGPSILTDTFTSSISVARPDSQMFTAQSIDLWGATVQYSISGLLNGQNIFTTIGSVPADNWSTILIGNAQPIDTLLVSTQRNNSEAVYLDNIALGMVVPEPSSVLVLAAGSTLLFLSIRRQFKA